MAKKVQAIPAGYHSVTPSLVVRGAAQAIEFYKDALGAEELMRFPGPDGSIIHAEIKIGDSVVMVMDEMPDQGGKSPLAFGGTSVPLFVYGDDVDSTWRRAIDAGAKPVAPLMDQFWGDRSGCIEDPFGHRWWISQHTEDLTREQQIERAEAFFAQTQPS